MRQSTEENVSAAGVVTHSSAGSVVVVVPGRDVTVVELAVVEDVSVLDVLVVGATVTVVAVVLVVEVVDDVVLTLIVVVGA